MAMTDILIERADRWGVITLNRPQALNALTLEMIRAIAAALAAWQDDKAVGAILLRAAPGRAFCAGGDIKAAYRDGLAFKSGAGMNPALYFAEEYLLDLRLHASRKPVVALLDGIVMGGGFGLAGPCRYRVATENTVFAMPEVGIGFFPDVGSVWFLRDCPGETGAYLALTGNSTGPGDMLAAGLATHYVPAGRLGDCAVALLAGTADGIPAKLERFAARPPAADLAARREVIDRCFAFDSVREIMQALALDGSAWARTTFDTITGRAPVSVVATLAHLRAARGQDFATIIARDFALGQHFLADEDFYEGVRAAVIDKDRAPRWSPAALDAVDAATVARYFGPAARSLDEFSL